MPTSLYSPDAFEVPNGLSLPITLAIGNLGGQFGNFDPYASTTQSRNLRVIESRSIRSTRPKTIRRTERRLHCHARADVHIANRIQSRFPVVDGRLQSLQYRARRVRVCTIRRSTITERSRRSERPGHAIDMAMSRRVPCVHPAMQMQAAPTASLRSATGLQRPARGRRIFPMNMPGS